MLGRVAVVHDGAELGLTSPRVAAVLADLLVHANDVVSTSRLVEDLWGGGAPQRFR